MRAEKIIWAGGEHRFRLGIGELRALQSACDAGPEAILARIMSGDWRIDDLFEPVRLGLIGGGDVTLNDAGPLVTRIIHQHPLLELKPVAQAVIISALVGVEDDPLGEPEGETTPLKSGSSADFTAPVP